MLGKVAGDRGQALDLPEGPSRHGPFGQGGSDLIVAMLADKMDTLIAATMAQPAKNAAGMAAR